MGADKNFESAVPPQWVWLIGKTVNTLHSHDFTRAQAARILTHCIQCVLTEDARWVGDNHESGKEWCGNCGSYDVNQLLQNEDHTLYECKVCGNKFSTPVKQPA